MRDDMLEMCSEYFTGMQYGEQHSLPQPGCIAGALRRLDKTMTLLLPVKVFKCSITASVRTLYLNWTFTASFKEI